MLKKTFFGFSRSLFQYKTLSRPAPKHFNIAVPDIITLHLKIGKRKTNSNFVNPGKSKNFKVGTKVSIGEKIYLFNNCNEYVVSNVCGTILSIKDISHKNKDSLFSVTIKTSKKQDEIDKNFSEISKNPTLETMNEFLEYFPGKPSFESLINNKESVKMLVLYGGDSDVFLHTSIRTLVEESEAINDGVNFLRKITGIKKIVLAVPEGTIQNYSGHLNAELMILPSIYPYAQPLMIYHKITGKIPKYNLSEIDDIIFFRLEGLVSISHAINNSQIPTRKKVTIVEKNKIERSITATIGTHTKYILEYLNITLNEKDKVIFGGPMTGTTIYSEEQPILSDTDLIFIQSESKNEIINSTNEYPCINCGECIKACPANVPVNLLIRFLEAGRYNEGAELYDLHSCIECGICSYVCISKIPIFQYIKLAKYELYSTYCAEEMNE